MKTLRALALSLLLAAPAAASDLTLNGSTAAEVPFGGSFQVELQGGATLPAFVFFDVTPGPTLFEGESVPLGFTAALGLLVSGTTDGAGSFQTPFFLAEDPSYAGAQLFLAGVILDGTDPNGLDVSNGAQLTIVPKAGAGDPQTTLVDRPTALDGSAATLADGTLAAGTSVLWQVLSRPAGSVAQLVDAGELFPSFAPDVAGDYTIGVTVSKGGVDASSETVVHAYDLTLTPGVDGQYVVTPLVSVQGAIEGPAGVTAMLNGNPLPLGPGGSFGPLNEAFAADDVFLPLLFELQHPDGSGTRERVSVGQGLPLPLSFPAVKALEARLNPAGYDLVEDASIVELEAADIESILLAQGAVQIVNEEGLFGFTIFSATVEFLSASYGSIDVDLTPNAVGAAGAVNLFNVNADFRVTGELLEISYDLTGDMSSNPTVISANLGLTPSGTGTLDATLQSLSVNLQNFNFNLDGFLGDVAELFIIESSVKEDVEDAVAETIAAEFPPAVEEILSAFVIEGNLFETLEIDVDISAPITGVINSSAGTTIQLDGNVAIVSSEPGSPAVNAYRTTLTAPPPFGSTTPGGQPYEAGLAAADDFLNQVLAAGTGAGLLNGDMTTLFEGTKGAGELFFTDVLSVLFPGAGFDKFPEGTQVGLRAEGTLPPIVRTTPGGSALGRIDMSDLEAIFEVAGPGGPIPVLRVTIDAGAELELDIDGSGNLLALLGESTVDAQALQGMSGSNLALLDQGIEFLEGVLVPQLTKLFEGIPLPSLEAQGIGLAPSEVTVIGSGLDYVGFYGDLVLLPPVF
ncbi:MAG: hypothetical protein AAF682_22185 [Planctomycetota bacterium]